MGYSFPVHLNITFTEIIAPQWQALITWLCWGFVREHYTYMFDCAMKWNEYYT